MDTNELDRLLKVYIRDDVEAVSNWIAGLSDDELEYLAARIRHEDVRVVGSAKHP